MDTFINQFDWEALLIIALAVSLIVEAIDRITPSTIAGKWLLVIVAFIVTVVKMDFDFNSVEAIKLLIFNTLLTMSVAILFYNYMGHWIVQKIFDFIKAKSEIKLP